LPRAVPPAPVRIPSAPSSCTRSESLASSFSSFLSWRSYGSGCGTPRPGEDGAEDGWAGRHSLYTAGSFREKSMVPVWDTRSKICLEGGDEKTMGTGGGGRIRAARGRCRAGGGALGPASQGGRESRSGGQG